MIKNKLKFLVGGEAGDGVFAVGDMIALSYCRAGLEVATTQEYSSRIRGGHINCSVRAEEKPLFNHGDDLDLVIALDLDSVQKHFMRIRKGGILLYDNSGPKFSAAEFAKRPDLKIFPLPAKNLAKDRLGMPVMKNVIMVGAAAGLTDFDPDFAVLRTILEGMFLRKGIQVVNKNIEAAEIGRDQVKNLGIETGYKLEPIERSDPKMLIDGNDAFSFGALVAGCRFVASYPITPASDVMEYMVRKFPKYNGVMVQAEDELAALNMTIGAAFAGARAMTSSSGPGISLMMEALGLASMTETSLVIADIQRCGPSTGMPTKTEQGDLSMLIYGSHGETPRIVLAPSDTEECFWFAIRAFNLAEKYQCPVIFASDQYLGQSKRTIPRFDLGKVEIDRGLLLSEEELKDVEKYFRYAYTETGVSPRVIPSTRKGIFKTSGAEHDDWGNATENPEIRVKMMDKIFRKLDFARAEMLPPHILGNRKSDVTLIGWGSTKGIILEAMEMLKEEDGIDLKLMHITDVWPFPDEFVSNVMGASKKNIVIENNFTGQMASLIRSKTGYDSIKILKYDGRPFAPRELYHRVKDVL
ncbi:MAG: 2-oxoacid:acceptor oxidoreductase subunit alpha [Candidatus Tectomicrobia bacterium]|nr:2-oxoacid:acceptor oxidoreductase subunit alpha [Candidatus Tectomicrobia bacterium]